jgi:hypothetical protein
MTKDEIAREEAEMAEQRKRLAALSKPQGGSIRSRIDPDVSPAAKRYEYRGVRYFWDREYKRRMVSVSIKDGRYVAPLVIGESYWDAHDGLRRVSATEFEVYEPKYIEKVERALASAREARDEAARLG